MPQVSSKQHSSWQVFVSFLKLGVTAFGGPIAHIGYFRKEFVERQRWLSEAQFSQLLALCQFLPGPASSQLGFALGLQRSGWRGALAAFTAFTLPSAMLLVAFASVMPHLNNEFAAALIRGLKLVAVAVVADALLGMTKNLCTDMPRKTIAVLSLCGLLLVSSPFMQLGVVGMGALLGWRWIRSDKSTSDKPDFAQYSQKVGAFFFACFLGFLIGLPLISSTSIWASISNEFYRAGALVFGGGHVVLPLLEEGVVANSWVNQQDFLAGYGAAQAVPGPLFTLSAYLGASIPTGASAVVGATVALLAIFLPGFLLLTAVLPYWQTVMSNHSLRTAIQGVNSAVVGLLAAAFYDPIFTVGISNKLDLAIALLGFALLTIWKRSPLWVVLWCTSASIVVYWIT